MNDFLRNFIMEGIRDMIAKDVALYQTYQYASGWFSKGVLVQEDLAEIQRLYTEKTEIAESETEETTETVNAEEVAEEITEESEEA